MRYLLSIIFCLWASCAWAFPPGFIGAVTQVTGTSTPTYLYDFEETGTPTGFTSTLGSPNYDATPGIQGNESLLLEARTLAADQEVYFGHTQETAGARVVVKLQINCSDVSTAASDKVFARFATNTSNRVSFFMNASKLKAGTTVATVSSVSANTNYYVWITYDPGSGSDGFYSIGFNESDSRPTSGDNYVEITTSTQTVDANRVYLGGDNYTSSTASYNCKFEVVDKWEE